MLLRRPALLVLAAVLAAVLAPSCSRRSGVAAEWDVVPGVGLEVPRLAGWQLDPSVQPPPPGAGGLALRLVRTQAVAGSPRLEVVLEPRRDGGTTMQDLLERNLRDMSALERSGSIRIERVAETAVSLGSRRAYRVRHEYVVGSGDVRVTQVSVLLVVGGRGVAVTAAGRTELYSPLAGEIDTVLSGLRAPAAAGADPDAARPGSPEPIDLGRLGGERP